VRSSGWNSLSSAVHTDPPSIPVPAVKHLPGNQLLEAHANNKHE
jgi:hypothetical protein